jgi:hypothetical protein
MPADFDFDDKRPGDISKRRRRSNLSLILLAVGGLSLFVCCGGCAVLLRPWEHHGSTTYPNRVTEVNYRRIEMGMTLQEVEEVLGPTTKGASISRRPLPVGNIMWQDGVEISETLEKDQKKASFYMWEDYPTRILISFDKMPPGGDATVNSKAFYVRTENKAIYLSDHGSKTQHTASEVRLP